MRVARSLEEAAAFEPVAVTIGNFDGVHTGHHALLREVARAAREKGLQPAVLTFDPHPASIVAPQRAARLLTTQAERCSLLAREGIEYVLVLPFTREMAHWTPQQFVERVLVTALRARVVIVGDNFRFGHDQAGDTNVLAQLGERFGFETRVITPVKRRGRAVSSSEIRRAVESGKVALAGRLLGRPYSTAGTVVPVIPLASQPVSNVLVPNPASLTFDYVIGGANPAAQNVALASTLSAINYSSTVTPAGSWLNVTSGSGTTPTATATA